MTGALDGVKVLDLTHVLAGPFCTYMLAVHGADVVKIEDPACPDSVRGRGPDRELNAQGMGMNFLTQNGNKRSLAINLKTEAGRKVLLELAAGADVLVENYRTGALDALGLGYTSLSALNPRLIYCSLTGFGQGRARRGVNAYDNVIQAASGLMAMTGTPDSGPLKVGASIVDYAAGMAAALAVSLALIQREKSGQGTYIDCSMLDTTMMLMGTQVTAHYAGAPAPKRKGSNQAEAGLGLYDTADGQVMLGAFNARQHERLWIALRRPDFAALSSWDDMHANADAMRQVLANEFRGWKSAELEAWLHDLGVPAERVRSIDEGLSIVESQGRSFTAELPLTDSRGQPVRVPLAPFNMTTGTAAIHSAPPRVGQHNEQILTELGYGPADIDHLRSIGAL